MAPRRRPRRTRLGLHWTTSNKRELSSSLGPDPPQSALPALSWSAPTSGPSSAPRMLGREWQSALLSGRDGKRNAATRISPDETQQLPKTPFENLTSSQYHQLKHGHYRRGLPPLRLPTKGGPAAASCSPLPAFVTQSRDAQSREWLAGSALPRAEWGAEGPKHSHSCSTGWTPPPNAKEGRAEISPFVPLPLFLGRMTQRRRK